MAVIEYEARASASADVTFVEIHVDGTGEGSALIAGGGDEPQPENLVRSDADLVTAMLANTRPIAPDRFVG